MSRGFLDLWRLSKELSDLNYETAGTECRPHLLK